MQSKKESYQLIYQLILSDERKSERQVAKELGTSQATVNRKKHRVLEQLREAISKLDRKQ